MNKRFFQASIVLFSAVLLTACGQPGPGPAGVGTDPPASGDPSSQTTMTAMVLPGSAMATAAQSSACALDRVNANVASTSTFTIDADAVSTFSGWAVDATNSAPPSVTVVLEGAKKIYGLSTLTGQARPDVAKVLGNPAAQTAGFLFHATLEQVPAGVYHALLWINTSTGNTLCDTRKQIIVKR